MEMSSNHTKTITRFQLVVKGAVLKVYQVICKGTNIKIEWKAVNYKDFVYDKITLRYRQPEDRKWIPFINHDDPIETQIYQFLVLMKRTWADLQMIWSSP